MAYLVDAHALIWHRNGDSQLPERVRDLLGEGTEPLFISDATFWELTIKHSIGRLTLRGGVESLYQEWIGQQVAQILPIRWHHIQKTALLPQLHGDPFDRMLLAQAHLEDLILVTGDSQVHQYPEVQILWR